MLTKDIYLYEYMDGWERFNETSLPVKRKFYSSLNMEKITNADYRQAKKARRNFEISDLRDYHDLYV